MASEFRDRRRIEFYETDMAGIVHFSNFFRYMEATEHAFFRSLGLSLHKNEGTGMSGWARVRASCEYRSPLHYQDEVEVELVVRDKGTSTLAYDFVFRRVDAQGSSTGAPEVARGALQVVHVARADARERMKASAMPPEVARAIDVAPTRDQELRP